MTRTAHRFSTSLAIFVLLLTTSVAAQDFEWQGIVDSGDSVTIHGVNGKIIAKPADGSSVLVEATKDANGDDPDSVRIEVIEDSEGVLICAVYPSRKKGKPNRCARGDDYKMNVNNNDVEVDFHVNVPVGVNLNAFTVNGRVNAHDLSGEVKAKTVNGGIDVTSSGVVVANTVNGSIDVSMGTSPREPIKFATVNGGIRIAMPQGTNADLSIKTINGHIDSDIPITIRGRWGPRSAKGKIGTGGPLIELNTVNGSIEIISQ